MEDTLFNRTFRDSDGNIVLAQMPNLPLLVWITATLLKLILTSGNIHTGLDELAFGSLFTWAWLELFQGVNYFRRALGFIVLLGALASRLPWSWQSHLKLIVLSFSCFRMMLASTIVDKLFNMALTLALLLFGYMRCLKQHPMNVNVIQRSLASQTTNSY